MLKLLHLAELQCTNSSPISNCWRSTSAIFNSRNINSNIKSFLRLCVETHVIHYFMYIHLYIYIYSDQRYIPEVEMKTIKGLPQAAPKKESFFVGNMAFGARHTLQKEIDF